MKSKFSVTFKKVSRKSGEVSQTEVDDFLTYLKHHREGLKETTKFLAFYAERQVGTCNCGMVLIKQCCFCTKVYSP